jgi:Holliday junction resolvase RusA-like endonuclease
MITFFVPGVPVPKGSAKAFVVKGRAIVTQDNRAKQKPWASLITYTAEQYCRGMSEGNGPRSLVLTFFMPRPKSHYGTGKNAARVKPEAPEQHTKKPDLDKLVRCVKDALTGVAWADDSQVSNLAACKIYRGDSPGVLVTIGNADASACRTKSGPAYN